MLSLFKKKPQVSENLLFLIKMHIGRGTNTDMPANLAGAYVSAYVASADYKAALRGAVAQTTKRGYEFIDLADGKVEQLDPFKWESYVHSAWPEYASHFPSQAEVLAGLSSGLVFFGPFASYEPQRA